MKKTTIAILSILGVGGIGYAIYRFYKKQFALLADFDYEISGIRVNKLSLNNISLDISVRFGNKSKIEATVSEIFLDVFLEGQKVGFISDNKPFVIPSNGTSDVSMNVTFNPQLIFKSALPIILSGISKKDLNFMFKGNANIKSGIVSTTLPINISKNLSTYL